MKRQFETELKELKTRILEMGGCVEQAIDVSTRPLTERGNSSSDSVNAVHAIESKINQAHVEVDNRCLEILARNSPVAADLRLILAIIKINTDLERIGDQAVNIWFNASDYMKRPKVYANLQLDTMANSVKAMVRESLDAFMREDTELAQKVLESDDAVDALKNDVFRKLIPHMRETPSEIEASLDLILIARNLERMGDHATNIAEDVIFAFTGEDVRHGIGQST